MFNINEALFVILGAIIGIFVGYYIRKNIGEGKINNAEELAKQIVEEAKREGESQKKELLLEAKEEIHRLRTEADRENRERRNEIQRLERRVQNKEEAVDRKMEAIERKEELLIKKGKELEEKEVAINDLYEQQLKELEKLSGLTSEEAKEILLEGVKREIAHETAVMIKEMENEAKMEAEKRAKEIITTAIQRYAADHV
ncbi:MAG: DUF3552 domain-containing protein, partial [Tissierellia bacterium]|nr:DUF3552 domain-containing protein [Tissierellia bacterium]